MFEAQELDTPLKLGLVCFERDGFASAGFQFMHMYCLLLQMTLAGSGVSFPCHMLEVTNNITADEPCSSTSTRTTNCRTSTVPRQAVSICRFFLSFCVRFTHMKASVQIPNQWQKKLMRWLLTSETTKCIIFKIGKKLWKDSRPQNFKNKKRKEKVWKITKMCWHLDRRFNLLNKRFSRKVKKSCRIRKLTRL